MLCSQQLRASSKQQNGASSPSLLSHRTTSVTSNRPWASPESCGRHISSAGSIGRKVGSSICSSNDASPCASTAVSATAGIQRKASMEPPPSGRSGCAVNDATAQPAEPRVDRRTTKVSRVPPTDPSGTHRAPNPAEEQTEAQRRRPAGDTALKRSSSAVRGDLRGIPLHELARMSWHGIPRRSLTDPAEIAQERARGASLGTHELARSLAVDGPPLFWGRGY